MQVKLHNKVEIISKEKTYVFYNNLYESVLNQLKFLKPYNKFIAVGNGLYNNNNEKTQKLTNFIKKYELNDEFISNNIKNNELYIKKSLVIRDDDLDDEYICELGLCADENDNPIIYDQTLENFDKLKDFQLNYFLLRHIHHLIIHSPTKSL